MTPEQVADQLLVDLAPHDTVAAALIGAEGDQMPRVAPADFEARHRAAQRALARLGDEPGVLADTLRERLGSDLALDDIGFTASLLAPLATPVHAIRSVFDTVPAAQVGDHLARVPGALRDYAETLRLAPRTVARRQVLGAAAQCRKWIEDDNFYARLVADQPGFTALAEAASKATMEFAEFLTGTLLPRSPETDAVGPEIYAVTAGAFLGDTVDLTETYAFGWEELRTLSEEMSALAGSLGASSVAEAIEMLDADPTGQLVTGELEAWLGQRLAETAEAVDGVHFDLPSAAKIPAARLSPTAVGVMYYDAPDPELTRPGTVWWAPPATGRTSSWREVTTVHHEGIPGHHLQIATALTTANLHPWQRGMVHVHGYAEGWAHYAERLADGLGLLRNDGERLGMLLGQRWRAARIVIDMGLHLDLPIPPGNGFTTAERWTPEVGRDVLIKAAGCDATTARFEIDRYLGWPAQALAFRVGARLWSEIRAAAEQQPDFDARTFHMAALRLGPMGLETLRKTLA